MNTEPTLKPPAIQPLPPATCYAEWRARADIRLAEMERQWWEHKHAVTRLGDEINDLQHVMGNGASGGTAWTLHNVEITRRESESGINEGET